MHRPRRRRQDPQRSGPIRNAGEALREGAPWRHSPEPEDDASSAGVREGYRVIEEQIRRGHWMAQQLEEDHWSDDPYRREPGRRFSYEDEPRPGYGERPSSPSSYGEGAFRLLGMPLRHLERLIQEILGQIRSARPDPWRLARLLFELQIEAVIEIGRLGFATPSKVTLPWAGPFAADSFEDDAAWITRDIDDTLEEIEQEERDEEIADEPWSWPAAPSAPTVVRSTVPIPVWVWSDDRTEVDLDLAAGAQSLPLEIEPPLAAGTGQPPRPSFEAELVTIAAGLTILRITVPGDLPAGLYLRRISIRSTGAPVGTLTVQVGSLPKPSPAPRPRRKRAPKPSPKPAPKPRARKR